MNIRAVQAACAHQNIGNRLTGLADIQHGEVAAHSLAYADHAIAGWVDAGIFNKNLGVRDHEAGCQEEGSGGDITRNRDFFRKQFLCRFDDSRGALCAHIRAKLT